MLSQSGSLKPQKSWHKSRSISKWLSITQNFAFTWKNKTELSKIDLRQRFKQPQETWASQTFARLMEDAQTVDSSKSTRHFPGTHGWREINQENGIFPVEFMLESSHLSAIANRNLHFHIAENVSRTQSLELENVSKILLEAKSTAERVLIRDNFFHRLGEVLKLNFQKFIF